MQILQAAVAIARTYQPLTERLTWPARPGSELARLDAAINSNITLTDTVVAGQRTAVACVLHLTELLEQGFEPRASVAVPLSRTALVSAAHVVYALGPQDPDRRLRNARTILDVQAVSHASAIKAFDAFQELEVLRPPSDLKDELRNSREALGGTFRREGAILKEMAEVVVETLVTAGHQDVPHPAVAIEHVQWIWHTWSGMAHGWAWPQYVPGLSDANHVVAPGHWVSDFQMVASIVQLAVELIVDALSIN